MGSGVNLVVGMRCRNELPLIPYRLANLKYASHIVISDQQSDDGTWEYLQKEAIKDSRIHLLSFPFTGWFHDQGNHLRSLFSAVDDLKPDWFQYTDVDDFPSILTQKSLISWLESVSHLPSKTALGILYYYLAPDWINYYTQPSGNRMSWLWDYVPRVTGSDDSKPLFAMEEPDIYFNAPSEWSICHWDWCCPKRFEDKLRRYASSPASHGTATWRPEEKYHHVTRLLDNVTWYDEDGSVVTPKNMVGRDL